MKIRSTEKGYAARSNLVTDENKHILRLSREIWVDGKKHSEQRLGPEEGNQDGEEHRLTPSQKEATEAIEEQRNGKSLGADIYEQN
jgi:hypothetical protein